jgi:hypothetical protein
LRLGQARRDDAEAAGPGKWCTGALRTAVSARALQCRDGIGVCTVYALSRGTWCYCVMEGLGFLCVSIVLMAAPAAGVCILCCVRGSWMMLLLVLELCIGLAVASRCDGKEVSTFLCL